MKTFYLICYDIKADSRRTKVAHLLESYGMRVQQSVFETLLDKNQYEKLESKLNTILNHQEDQLRFYPLSQHCRHKVKILGWQAEFAVDSPAFIV